VHEALRFVTAKNNQSMAKKKSLLQHAIKGVKNAFAPKAYTSRQNPVRCSICDHDLFKQGPDVIILSLHSLICADCSHVEFFDDKPETSGA
jgi:hypothetical protein